MNVIILNYISKMKLSFLLSRYLSLFIFYFFFLQLFSSSASLSLIIIHNFGIKRITHSKKFKKIKGRKRRKVSSLFKISSDTGRLKKKRRKNEKKTENILIFISLIFMNFAFVNYILYTECEYGAIVSSNKIIRVKI